MIPIRTERLFLRCPIAGDGAAVNAAIRESWDELCRWMVWASGPMPDVSETEARMARAPDEFSRGDSRIFGIFASDTGEFLGMASLMEIDPIVPKAEIGYWLRTSATGHGYMTEAARAVCAWGERELSLARIELRCDAKNVRSQSVANAAGFSLEGCLMNDRRDAAGELSDTLVYARTKTST